MFKNKKIKISLMIMMTLVGVLVGFGTNDSAQAVEVSAICRKSKECLEAAEKEEQANKDAEEAASTANAYQNKVNEAAAEISAKEREIVESAAIVDELKMRIEQSEAEIVDDREALVELLVEMHFEADAEPIRILAGATSISDLAEKAARAQVARQQINVQATKIKQEKEALEAVKAEVEAKLAEQQQAKQDLTTKRKERENLVAKYQNDMEAYEEQAAKAREEKQAAERAWQEAHRSSLSGLAYYSGDDTYPWQADCPGKQDYYLTYINGNSLGGYVCECVSYAGWKAYEAYGVYLSWGNAYSWDDGARADGYTVNNTPAAGTIGQVDGYPYGHVFWVESVNGDGSINVTEYNNAYATYLYTGNSYYGAFGARTIPASDVGSYNYIHL